MFTGSMKVIARISKISFLILLVQKSLFFKKVKKKLSALGMHSEDEIHKIKCNCRVLSSMGTN